MRASASASRSTCLTHVRNAVLRFDEQTGDMVTPDHEVLAPPTPPTPIAVAMPVPVPAEEEEAPDTLKEAA